jgi:4-diphosphocytidyl-2-C-methyl-D-erythritol kinase
MLDTPAGVLVSPPAMRTGADTLNLLAPAKVNLFLDVLGKRPDGYHELRSLVVPIAICDTLTFERSHGPIEVICEGEALPHGNKDVLPEPGHNLATRAAQLLKETTGYPGGMRLHLRKHIPIGGGLGGGSADAAAVLTGLNRLWDMGLPVERLMELGARIGSDIPALVYGRAVRMEGRGERVTPVTCHWPSGTAWWIVVVNPGFSVPTRDVYARHRTGLTSSDETYKCMTFALERGDVALAAANLHNSLEATVFAKYPLLQMVAERLREAGALGVLLSGSGASVFAVAASREHALAIEEQVRGDATPWLWTRVAQMLPDGVTVAHGPLEARV